ncbi:MAG: MBL fold metallo-hydrolase [Candidatus Kerfeldbacteria bacterium]|nr:MBL fold metallo-hydrolase [Candidatus Kerfeldbacteria bacterium]
MLIQWFGQACLKVQAKPGPNNEVTVIFDPFEPAKIGLKLPRLSGDVVAITHDHFDHNYKDGVSGDYFLINGPGEYEVKQTFIYGIPSWHDASEGKERGLNTMYLLEAEGLSLAHLGDFGQNELTSSQLEQLEGVDILVLPVGGVYTIDAKKAAELVGAIEPRIVIPIHYKIPGLKVNLEPVDKFVRELGLKAETMEKLKVTKKDLPAEETKLILLTP